MSVVLSIEFATSVLSIESATRVLSIASHRTVTMFTATAAVQSRPDRGFPGNCRGIALLRRSTHPYACEPDRLRPGTPPVGRDRLSLCRRPRGGGATRDGKSGGGLLTVPVAISIAGVLPTTVPLASLALPVGTTIALPVGTTIALLLSLDLDRMAEKRSDQVHPESGDSARPVAPAPFAPGPASVVFHAPDGDRTDAGATVQ